MALPFSKDRTTLAKLFFAVILSCFVLSHEAQADYYDSSSQSDNTSRSRFGLQFQRFKGGDTNSGTQGMLLGLRSSRYLYEGLSLGYEINVGAPQDGSITDNNLFYTGAHLGWDHSFAKIFFYDIGCLVGYGYGRSTSLNVNGQSLVLQPTIAVGLVVINGYRVSFNAGYLYMPDTSGLSGVTFGIRFERKSESVPAKPLDY